MRQCGIRATDRKIKTLMDRRVSSPANIAGSVKFALIRRRPAPPRPPEMTLPPLLHRFLPFLRWFPYSGAFFRADFLAGLTVALVLVPQSMAYAQLAGLPPYYGLYAAFLPVAVAALWGSSNQLGTGPVAVASLLTASVAGAAGRAGLRTVRRPGHHAGADGRYRPVDAGCVQARRGGEFPLPPGHRRFHQRGGHDHRPVAGQQAHRRADGPFRVLRQRHLGRGQAGRRHPPADSGHGRGGHRHHVGHSQEGAQTAGRADCRRRDHHRFPGRSASSATPRRRWSRSPSRRHKPCWPSSPAPRRGPRSSPSRSPPRAAS